MVSRTWTRAVRGRSLVEGSAEIGKPPAGHYSAGEMLHPAIGSRIRNSQEQDMEASPAGRSEGVVSYQDSGGAHDRAGRTLLMGSCCVVG
jgi:hypothetical protein